MKHFDYVIIVMMVIALVICQMRVMVRVVNRNSTLYLSHSLGGSTENDQTMNKLGF